MTSSRRHLTRSDLAPLARATTGGHRTLTAATRLRGGSKKGAYRLTFDDDTTAIAYVWSADEDYWDAGVPDPRDPFSHGTGFDLFTAAHDRLTAAGVRTPRLLYADPAHTHLPAEAVVVEDMTGGSLEEALERDPVAGRAALEHLAAQLATLHAHQGPTFGKVALVDNGGVPSASSCEERVTEGALRDIAEAAGRDARIAAVEDELVVKAKELAARIRPRTRHTLIHGELGPDHVLLDADGHPAWSTEGPAAVLRRGVGARLPADPLRPPLRRPPRPRPGRGPPPPLPPGDAPQPRRRPAAPPRRRFPTAGSDAGNR